jgi:hypothetical protein
MLKTNKTTLNAITGARLEHEKETSASDIADRILPFLKMPSPQDIAMHPWLGGVVSALETMLAARLMRNVSKEKERNRAKAKEFLDKEELEGKAEKERLNMLAEKMQKEYEADREIGRKKTFQEIENLKWELPLKWAKIEEKQEKAARNEDEKDFKDRLEDARTYIKNMSPAEYVKLREEIKNGKRVTDIIKDKGENFSDFFPFLNKTALSSKGKRYVVKKEPPKQKTIFKLDADGNIIDEL